MATMSTKQLRVLMVSNYFPPYVEGGYEIACAQTADYLAEQGHRIHVLSGNAHCDRQLEHRYPVSRTLHYIDYRQGNWRQKMQVEIHNHGQVLEKMRQFQPDLVYFWNLKGLSSSPIFAARHAKCKYLFEMGDDWVAAYLKPGPLAWLKRLTKALLTRGRVGLSFTLDPCIVVSDWMAEALQQRYGAARCFSIPNGTSIPEDIVAPAPGRLTSFLLAGRLLPEKGVDIVIDAAGRLLRQNQRDFRIDLVGPAHPDYRAACLQKIRLLGLADHIHWHAPATDMDAIYRAHDVLLMPTHTQEPFGLVLIEAMARELAVIATHGFGPSEIIQHETDGLLVDRHNAKALAGAMARLITQPDLRRQLARQGREKARRLYDVRRVKAQVESTLQAVVSGAQ